MQNLFSSKNLKNFAIGGGIGDMLSGIGGLFGIGKPNTGQANNYLAQMQPYVNQYLQPYINAGTNPTETLSKFGAGYQASPGYQYNVDQATKAANNAAAAGGFIGSPQQQEYMAKQIGGLASQDYNQYMNNALGLYNTGYGASMGATNTLSDMLKAQAQMAYSDAMNKANAQSSSSGGLFGGIGKMLGGLGLF